jgi:hypothetical protein
MTGIEYVQRVLENNFTIQDALREYADPQNWRTEYPLDDNGKPRGAIWVWQGPTICAYELAAYILTKECLNNTINKDELKTSIRGKE